MHRTKTIASYSLLWAVQGFEFIVAAIAASRTFQFHFDLPFWRSMAFLSRNTATNKDEGGKGSGLQCLSANSKTSSCNYGFK